MKQEVTGKAKGARITLQPGHLRVQSPTAITRTPDLSCGPVSFLIPPFHFKCITFSELSIRRWPPAMQKPGLNMSSLYGPPSNHEWLWVWSGLGAVSLSLQKKTLFALELEQMQLFFFLFFFVGIFYYFLHRLKFMKSSQCPERSVQHNKHRDRY